MAYGVVESINAPVAALEVIERLAVANGWSFDRQGDEELAAELPGEGCVYHLWFAWRPDRDALHFTCVFNLRMPEKRRPALYRLLAMINERMWMGHFDIWPDDGMVIFRQTLPLRGGPGLTAEQVEDLVDESRAACDRFYPAFQYVIWGGKSPSDALTGVMLDPVGEA